MSARRLPLALCALSLVAGGCSILVDTSGLSGSATTDLSEAGADAGGLDAGQGSADASETGSVPALTAAGCNSTGGTWGTKLIATGGCDWLYSAPGSYQWTAPAGATSIGIVCVGGGGGARDSNGGGGGGLGWLNTFSVTPGTSYPLVIGAGAPPDSQTAGGDSSFINATTVMGGGGSPGHPSGQTGSAAGGHFAGAGGGNGGTAIATGGGGAGGYSGPGGDSDGKSGTGGGGGAGIYTAAGSGAGGGGGGVGLYGQGADGVAQTVAGGGGHGGSGGTDATSANGSGTGGSGGTYGGGAGGGGGPAGAGGGGACRIVWPGDLRQFPSTLVGPP